MQKYHLSDKMWQSLAAIGIHTLSPIQQAAVPLLLQEKNVMMCAPTGTGKTYAFLIPIVERIDVTLTKTQALIMAPTRELASQIANVLQTLLSVYDPTMTYALAIGGKDRNRLLQTLRLKQPHILIGTPGRCEDVMIQEALIDPKDIKFAVLDETDMMFENGFLEAIDAIFSTIAQHQVCYAVCSATIPQALQHFIKKYLPHMQFIEVPKTAAFVAKTEYLLWDITGKDRFTCLMQVMDSYNPYLALVFANTKSTVDALYTQLSHKGYRVGILHGRMQTRERAQMLKRIRDLTFQYVICSDIAARGIDIDGVSHVINYELPATHALSFFEHRAGRTGRSQYHGTVFSLVEKGDRPKIQKLEKTGIVFKSVKLQQGTFVEIVAPKQKASKPVDAGRRQIAQQAKATANKKNKVKPRYKKKIKRAVASSLQKERRQRKKAETKMNKRG